MWAICEDKNGMLWIGTSICLYKFDRKKDKFTRFRYDNTDSGSISHFTIVAIYEDKEGSLWIGTRAGLDKYDFETGKFIHYWNDPSNIYKPWYNNNSSMYCANAIPKDDKGRMWYTALLKYETRQV